MKNDGTSCKNRPVVVPAKCENVPQQHDDKFTSAPPCIRNGLVWIISILRLTDHWAEILFRSGIWGQLCSLCQICSLVQTAPTIIATLRTAGIVGHGHPYPAHMLRHWQVLKELQRSFGESREPWARGCCGRAVASRQVKDPTTSKASKGAPTQWKQFIYQYQSYRF